MIAVGLMSGTSLDGIDAALVRIRPRGDGYAIELLRFATYPFAPELEAELRAALEPPGAGVAEIARLHAVFGEALGDAAEAILSGERCDYVASHGLTVFHDGGARVTFQIGDAFRIRERAGASVCYDFRSADCAAGGQGAPLVPYVDRLLFASDDEDRVALNIGGIANVTILRAGEEPAAYDTGPGNMLVDAVVRARTGGAQRFDRGGALAAKGHVCESALAAMLADPYFAQDPPKSTGRERFGERFLRAYPEVTSLALEDAVATVTELTAASVADAIARARLDAPRVIVSGGGASNAALVSRLAARLGNARVERSDAMGVDADAKEAVAFSVLGYETLRGRAASLPAVTGALRGRVLGAIAPYELRGLLERAEGEVQ